MSDAVRVFESEREIPCHYRLTLMVDADLPQLSEAQRDVISAKVQASLDRMILKALYGE